MSTLRTDNLQTTDSSYTVSVADLAVNATINTLKADLANTSDPLKGAALVGFQGSTVANWLGGLSISVLNYGAVKGDVDANGLTNMLAGRAAMAAASALSVSFGGAVTVEWPAGVYVVGGNVAGDFLGTNKVMFPPLSNVRVIGPGTLKIKAGSNTTAGGSGYNVFYPAEDLDAAVNNFEVIGLKFDGNGANNLNLVLRRNAMIGVLTGDSPVIAHNTFTNCAGFHIATIGRDIFPQTVSNAQVYKNVVHNIASAIPGNTGISDHSSFYLLATNSAANYNRFYNDTNDTIASAIELHGDNSEAVGNYYANFLNLVNLGGYINSVKNLRIADNIGANIQMLVRGYARFAHVIDEVVVSNNQVTCRTSELAVFDFGGAQVENLLMGSVKFLGNTVKYVGVDVLIPPPIFWIKGIKHCDIKGNVVKGTTGWAVLIGVTPTDAVINITENDFDDVNTTVTLTYSEAVYIENVSGAFKTIDVSRNTFRKCRQYALRAAATSVGGVVRFTNNTVTETPDLISVPSGSAITRVDVQHTGDLPASGQFLNGFTKISRWSTITCASTDTKFVMKQGGTGLFNKEQFGTVAPVSGTHFNGDIVWNTSPAAAGPAGFICTTSSSPGPMVWKNFAIIAA